MLALGGNLRHLRTNKTVRRFRRETQILLACGIGRGSEIETRKPALHRQALGDTSPSLETNRSSTGNIRG